MKKRPIDTKDLLEKRDMLYKLLEDAGIEVNGAGYGMGKADVSIIIDDKRYDISINPPVYLDDFRNPKTVN